MATAAVPDAADTAPAEGDAPEGSNNRPPKPHLAVITPTSPTQHAPNTSTAPPSAMTGAPPSSIDGFPHRPAAFRALSSSNVPMPSPDSRSFPKEPGLTHADLAASSKPNGRARSASSSSLSVGSSSSAGDSSEPSTPALPPATPSAANVALPPSLPPSRPPTAPPSRANSTTGRPGFFRKVSGKSAKAEPVEQLPSAPPTPKRAASVKSDDGGGHKFTLKDLLASGPKLGRRTSQRSTGSSRRSDSDSKSAAGDSTASLLKKYGVCEKVAIGKGATSVVRLAHKWDRTEEKLYAVKEFRKRRKNETEKEYVKKLTAEFCISSTLHHTNVVETVDLVQDEAQHWCEVMEFCPGGDLYAAIKRGGMSPNEVECCFKQMLAGVAYLHGQGVAHRDIKPENLLFDLSGHLKIGDFGASTVYRLPWEKQVHMSTGLCGSEPYIAPEQFLGKPYDARLVDVWACGIVYYCLHFQEIPWRVAQQSDALYAAYAQACASTNTDKAGCPPTINNLSPRACRPVLRKMLEPDPKKRWTIDEVTQHAWVESLETCYDKDKPGHIHVNTTAIAQQQGK